MSRYVCLVLILVITSQAYGSVQVQMPEASALQVEDPEPDLATQVKNLERNVTELWTYIYELRQSISNHLTHLREHQVELESTVHRLEYHGGHDSHTHGDLHGDDHHHDGHGEHHSHSGEQHSHSDEQHSHSSEQHSHSGEQHSHSDDHHTHSGEHGHSYSHSHSDGDHTHDHSDDHGHSDADHHHHHGDHKDSHENEDLQQQTQQVAEPVMEPVVATTQRREHYHHHRSHTQKPETSSPDPLQLMNENSPHHHHHRSHYHHHDYINRSRNRTVVVPKYSEYNLYDFAVCRVQPNSALPEDQQQPVTGQVSFWQRKTGGHLNIHVRLQGFSIGDHGAHQAMQQQEANEAIHHEGGHKHGFHIHAFGDLSNGCQSAGPHYNPKNVKHGGPNSLERHVGDLGNIECDDHGVTNVVFSDPVASLRGQYSVIGKAIVVHSDIDDLGLGGNPESLKTGNAGTRIACCVIERVEKLSIKTYKDLKTATQYQNQ